MIFFGYRIIPVMKIGIVGRIWLSVCRYNASTKRPLSFRLFSTRITHSLLISVQRCIISYWMWFPLLAVICLTVNGRSILGVIFTSTKTGWFAEPANRTLSDWMSANFSTIPVTTTWNHGRVESFVLIRTVSLIFLPPYPPVFTLTWIFPSRPGRICLVLEAAVHPQPDLISRIERGAFPLLWIKKSWTTCLPSITGWNVKTFSGIKAWAFGVPYQRHEAE